MMKSMAKIRVHSAVLLMIVIDLLSPRSSRGQEDEIELFVTNSRSIEKYCCAMEVEFVEDVMKVEDSRFHTQTFVFSVDRRKGKCRYDYLPDFDSREPDKIVAGAATYFIDEPNKTVDFNTRSLKTSKISFDQAKKLQGKVRFCDPFFSVLVGGAGFSDSDISGLVVDRQQSVLDRYVLEERREQGKKDIARYRISREAPVLADVTFSKELGEMPIHFRLIRQIAEGKLVEIGTRELEWRKLGNTRVPVLLKNTTTSNGGGPAKGGYAITCSVKYTWTTSLPDKLWLTGDNSGELFLTGDLIDYIHANASPLK
jgi:hypothetical protein